MMEMWLYEDRRYRKHARLKLGGIVGAVGGVVSGIMSAGAASDAANAQTNAAQNAITGLQTANQTVQQGYQPYTAAGTTTLGQLVNNLTSNTGFNFQADPGYQFTQQQGMDAIQGAAAAKGGVLSGGTLKSIGQYTTGLANQTYNDAFTRYQQQNQQTYNQLMGVTNLGYNATTQAGNATLNTASNIGNLYTQQGNAQAAGIIGQQNGINSAINSVSSAANQYSFLNATNKSPKTIGGYQL